MKSLIIRIAILAASAIVGMAIATPAFAQTANQATLLSITGNHEILQDVKELVTKCAVEILNQPSSLAISNRQSNPVLGFQSVCPSLQIVNRQQAMIYIENQWYVAVIYESEEADGGDLNNMSLYNYSTGQLVASRTNVAAYNQVVLAMAGGNIKLEQKYLP